MMDIAIIADEDTLLGFQLAGVKQSLIFSEDGIKEQLQAVREAKILILTEKVAEYLRGNDLMEDVESVIAEIPDKEGSTGTALRNIGRLLEEAIGVRLKGEE